MLARHGPGGLTIDRVAEESGISRATLYRHGVTKQRLLAGAFDEAARRYRDALWPAPDRPRWRRDRLEAAVRALCAVADDHLGLLAQPDTVFHDDADQHALVREPISEPFARILRDGQLDGTLHADDADETATVLVQPRRLDLQPPATRPPLGRRAHRRPLLAIAVGGLARSTPE